MLRVETQQNTLQEGSSLLLISFPAPQEPSLLITLETATELCPRRGSLGLDPKFPLSDVIHKQKDPSCCRGHTVHLGDTQLLKG